MSDSSAARLSVRDSALAIVLAACLFAVYLLTYRGGFHSVDEVSMFAVTENIVKQGTFDTNQVAWTQWATSQREAQGFFGADGSVYSKKGLALSLFGAPLYRLALHTPGVGLLQTVSLLNALLTAAAGAVLYLYGRRLAYSAAASALLGLIFGLATTAWVYARYLFSEPLSGVLLLLAAYFLLAYKQTSKSVFVLGAGLAAGLTVLTRANNAIVLPFFALYLITAWVHRDASAGCARLSRDWGRHGLLFGVAVAVPLGLVMVYNWTRSGNPFQTGYDLTIFSPSIVLGLYKLLLSPLRGLFGFAPVLLLSLVAFYSFVRRHRAEALLAAGVVGANVLLFSAWTSGEGLSWGSRFMVPVLAFWTLPLIDPLDRLATRRRSWWMPAFVVLGALSVVVQALGVAVNPWLYMMRLQELFPAEFLENTPVLWDPRYSPIVGQAQGLWLRTGAGADVAWWQPSGVQVSALVVSLLVVALTVLGLWHLLRREAIATGKLAALVGGVVLVTALGSFFCLRTYYRFDYQFGLPGNAFDRLWAHISSAGRPGDAIMTIAPAHYHVPMNRYKGSLPILGLAQMDLPLAPQAGGLLNRALADHRRIWLVTSGLRPGEPQNGVERWLAERAFKAADDWYDDARLCLWASPSFMPATQPVAPGAQLGDAITLDAAAIGLPEAGLLPIALTWRATQPIAAEYVAFVQLLTPDGRLTAGRDSVPGGGFAPTTGWLLGQAVVDRYALALPAPGRYAVVAGLYDSSSGRRLPVRLADGTHADHVTLAEIDLREAGSR